MKCNYYKFISLSFSISLTLKNPIHLTPDYLENYMQYAIACALRADKSVASNPKVGACLVYDNKIIGEGWHQKFGEPHAEVNAVNSVNNHNRDKIKDSTLFVTLEPCNHHGKTPPCTSLIINNRIKHVVIGTLDPNPKVSGNGVRILKENGVEVITGICEQQCKDIIRPFIANIIHKRPYICLKWAQSSDAFIGQEGKTIWLTNSSSKLLVHKWRSQFDAIMVGNQTLRQDNPELTVRLTGGVSPTKIVLDLKGHLPQTLKVFDTSKSPLFYFSNHNNTQINKPYDIQVFNLNTSDYDKAINKVMTTIFEHGINSIFIEGGSRLLHTLINMNLWDEARVLTTKHSLGSGLLAPSLDQELFIDMFYILDNQCSTYINNNFT